MKILDIFRSIKPSVEDESCEYILTRIIDIYKRKKIHSFKLISVSSGLSRLIKIKYGGEFIPKHNTYLINPTNNIEPIEISCNLKDLEDLLAKLRKEE